MTDDTTVDRLELAKAIRGLEGTHPWDDIPASLRDAVHSTYLNAADRAIAYLATLPAREPVTEDDLVELVERTYGSGDWETHREAVLLARAILAEFDVTKKEQ